jgi:hypothetical protein
MAKIIFYGLVSKNENMYKPFFKSTSYEECQKIISESKNDSCDIIKYVGYKRTANRHEQLVITDIAR